MKSFDSQNIDAIKAIETQMWSIAEVLRSESISSDEYYVLLFFLSAYKDGLIPEEASPIEPNPENSLTTRISKLDEQLMNQYLPIYNGFTDVLRRISQKAVAEIIKGLNQIDIKELSDNFKEVFDKILYRIASSEGRLSGQFIQPIEITRLMVNLVNLPRDATVYNPFAGLASFGAYFDEGENYFGQENDHRTWALGALRLMAYNRTGNTAYLKEDSILEWPVNKKFDLIIATPPFGNRINKGQYPDIDPKIRTFEQFLLNQGISSLEDDGKLIALLPHGFLTNGGVAKRIREELIEQDYIETVISLPAGILFNTGIKLCLLVINKMKNKPGIIRFVDSIKFTAQEGRFLKKLDDHKLLNYLSRTPKDDDKSKFVDSLKIREQDYDLNVSRYFLSEIKDGIALENLLTPYCGESTKTENSIKLIRIKDLHSFNQSNFSNISENYNYSSNKIYFKNISNKNIDFKLDSSLVDFSNVGHSRVQKLTKSCILMARNFRSLKPTFFEFSGEALYTNQNILAFVVDESKVDVSYLIYELSTEYVEEQVEAYRTGGAAIPFIKASDLLKVQIKLPSLEAQRSKVKGIIELSERIKSLQNERNALAHGQEVNRFSEFASLKHTLGRPRQNILDWADNLLDFMNSNKDEFGDLNNQFIDFYDVDMISALEEIKRDVNFMTKVLEKGENGFKVEDYDQEIIPLSEINKIVREISGNSYDFKIKKLLIKGEKLNDRGIYGNKTLFRTLLENLLTNAHKHGFEKKKKGNEVVIDMTEVDDKLVVEVRNNGKPFPKNFDKEKFIAKFSTADVKGGTGLGGYDVHRIAELFENPDWELMLDEDPIYRVKFKFKFPTKLIS